MSLGVGGQDGATVGLRRVVTSRQIANGRNPEVAQFFRVLQKLLYKLKVVYR
jgi:hypothetical protein